MSENKKETSVMINLGIGMLIVSGLVQIMLLFISQELLYHSVGLWIGSGIGFTMLLHMKRTIEDALDAGEEHAEKYMLQKSMLRLVIVSGVFFAIAYLQIGSILTAFIGAMGLKISVYLQPYIYKVRNKARKNLRKGG